MGSTLCDVFGNTFQLELIIQQPASGGNVGQLTREIPDEIAGFAQLGRHHPGCSSRLTYLPTAFQGSAIQSRLLSSCGGSSQPRRIDDQKASRALEVST